MPYYQFCDLSEESRKSLTLPHDATLVNSPFRPVPLSYSDNALNRNQTITRSEQALLSSKNV